MPYFMTLLHAFARFEPGVHEFFTGFTKPRHSTTD